jgi:hypothetical protein
MGGLWHGRGKDVKDLITLQKDRIMATMDELCQMIQRLEGHEGHGEIESWCITMMKEMVDSHHDLLNRLAILEDIRDDRKIEGLGHVPHLPHLP